MLYYELHYVPLDRLPGETARAADRLETGGRAEKKILRSGRAALNVSVPLRVR
jgi:hypothetical protein